MQNDTNVAAAAASSSTPVTVARAQTVDTISAMFLNSASLMPPTLYPIGVNVAAAAATTATTTTTTTAATTTIASVVPTIDEIEQVEADEAIAAVAADRAKKRAHVKTREHVAIRLRLTAMRNTYAAREKAEKALRMQALLDHRRFQNALTNMTRQQSEE